MRKEISKCLNNKWKLWKSSIEIWVQHLISRRNLYSIKNMKRALAKPSNLNYEKCKLRLMGLGVKKYSQSILRKISIRTCSTNIPICREILKNYPWHLRPKTRSPWHFIVTIIYRIRRLCLSRRRYRPWLIS